MLLGWAAALEQRLSDKCDETRPCCRSSATVINCTGSIIPHLSSPDKLVYASPQNQGQSEHNCCFDATAVYWLETRLTAKDFSDT